MKPTILKNEDLSTVYDPTFLLNNLFLLTKWGCLQKPRAQYVKIWQTKSVLSLKKRN